MGGAALVAAELARPGTFAKLVLEPIIFRRLRPLADARVDG